MNVNWFAQTPGIEEAAFGIFSHRSGLEKKRKKYKSDKPIAKQSYQLESCGIFPPYRFISVDEGDRYYYRLTLSDPISSESRPT